ncbi:MAG TPA: ABC transporter permease [Terriglobales bacterium]|nr:ABC transporter permease [Terriglobales bacterium]
MSLLRSLGVGLRALFRKEETEQELQDELRSYMEASAGEKMRRGMSVEEARRAARLELGSTEAIKEEVRGAGWENMLETCAQDLRYALRALRKSPGFTIVAVLTLALGIGANASLFSVVNTVLLQPLPFKNPSRLMMLFEGLPQVGSPKIPFSTPDYTIVKRGQKSFEAIGAVQDKEFELSGHGEPDRIIGARVSASIFPMLGIAPVLGRFFRPEEDAPGQNVAVLSYGLWQRQYGGRPDIVGETIELDRQPYTVIGVMPRHFVFPLPGPIANFLPAALWVPMAFTPAELQGWGMRYDLSVLACLRPGVSLQQASSEGQALGAAIEAQYPRDILKDFYGARLLVTPLPWHEEVTGPVRPLLLVLMVAVGLVLLIACANVATLLVSRAAARQREIAIRKALGATRVRLLRQLLTESLLLALLGGGLGLLLALWGKDMLLALAPADIPLPQNVGFGLGVLLFAFGISCLTAILFGLAPAWHTAASKLQQSLQEGGRSRTAGRARHRLQNAFVAVEFGLSLVLLIGAGLLLRSFGKLLQTDLGFQPDHVLTMEIPLPAQAYPQASQIRNFYQRLADEIPNLPGVKAAGIADDLPLRAAVFHTLQLEGRPQVGKPPAVAETWTLGNYFQTMGIPLIAGRLFNPQDGPNSPPVVIISRGMAKKYWPGQDAIGKRLRHEEGQPWITVVGVVGDVNDGPVSRPIQSHIYIPFVQLSDALTAENVVGVARSMNLAVRTAGEPSALATAVVAKIHSLDPDIAVAEIGTMTQVISSSLAGPKFNTWLLSLFAGFALFLSAIGIYGVLAYAVTQQRHEIGIRMALGARPRHVLRFVLAWGTRLACLGAAFGIVAALALTRLMKGLLYGVRATDPLTFAGVTLLLLSAAVLASLIPARRATKVDPMVALRCE